MDSVALHGGLGQRVDDREHGHRQPTTQALKSLDSPQRTRASLTIVKRPQGSFHIIIDRQRRDHILLINTALCGLCSAPVEQLVNQRAIVFGFADGQHRVNIAVHAVGGRHGTVGITGECCPVGRFESRDFVSLLDVAKGVQARRRRGKVHSRHRRHPRNERVH